MNCTCIRDIERKIADFMKEKAGDDAKAKVIGEAYVVNDAGLASVLQIPFRVKGSKKGYTSEKGKEVGCNIAYCPFCGRNAARYVVGEDSGLEAAMAQEAA